MNVTRQIAKYLERQHIAVDRVALDTGVASAKLKIDTKDKLSATEFLEVCSYLNIKPEDLDNE